MISDVISACNYGVPNLVDTIDFKANFSRLAKETKKITFEYDPNAKNRFNDIYCPKHTALRIKDESDEQTLHANIVQIGNIKVICTQAPLAYDNENTTELFWKAMLDHSNMIIDLTNPKDMTTEGGVQAYYPEEKGDVYITGTVRIECTTKQVLQAEPLIEEITYEVSEGERKKTVRRLHFNGWPDGQALSPEILIELIDCVKAAKNKASDTLPEMVHCRAGIGRTGCLVVSQALMELIGSDQINESNLMSTIDKLILEGRQARGPNLVQTENQYKSIVLLGIYLLKMRKKVVKN